MILEEVTTVEASNSFTDVEVAIFSGGSTEQHGPALPLCTDSKAAETVARGVADRNDVVVLPTIPIGVSPHHRQFHGTLWVSAETFEEYLAESLTSLVDHSIEKIVVNGHGGNVTAIERVARDFYRDESAFVVPWSWWDGVGAAPSEQFGDDVEVSGHAGAVEAAMMLYAAGHLMNEGRFEEAASGRGSGSRFDHPDVRGFDFVDWTDNGVSADPQQASPRQVNCYIKRHASHSKNSSTGSLNYRTMNYLPVPTSERITRVGQVASLTLGWGFI